MILADLFESSQIHNRPKLDSVLDRCIELVHKNNAKDPERYGKVAACIIDSKNRKVFGINLPGSNGTRRHAERVAIDAYHKKYGKILPGAIIVTTLSPCNRDMAERDGPSCQDLLLQVGIEKVYSGYIDPSQHSDHPFTEETTRNDDLWQACKELSDSFVHDDLTEDRNQGAAGIILYAEDTGRYGLQQRSDSINDPGQWAAWGGGREPGESLEQCARRELAEESGYTGPVELHFLASNPKYTTFIGIVPHEFKPRPDPEWKDFCWVEAGDWPGPMHPGVAAALKNIPIDEGVKSRLAQAALAGGLALGAGGANAMDWKDAAMTGAMFVPGIGQAVKAYNVGKSLYQAGTAAKQYRDLDKELTTLAAKNKAENPRGPTTVTYDPNNADKFDPVDENFADGRNPQDKGDSKRYGVPTKASVSTLRKVAKQGGRKGQLAHWMANMKAGRAKAKK
jgi:8-oxo-dGTP pyrophosphatase MutT (NUDIX family)/pyrimidine deaminase RibD-like protein